MKQIACSAMGGPSDCQFIIKGNTPEEMVENGMKHMSQVHPEMAAKIMSGTKEQDAENEKWMNGFREQFKTLEEV